MAKAHKKAMLQNEGGRPMPDFNKIKFSNEGREWEMVKALNYASYTFETKDQKLFASEYAKKKLGLTLTSIPDWELQHIGNICWLINNECDIKNVEEYDEKIKALHKKYTVKKEDKKKVVQVDASAVLTGQLMGELEGIIDDVVMGKSDITNPIVLYRAAKTFKEAEIRNHFTKQLEDITAGGEGYDELDDDYKKRVVLALTFILKQLDEYKEVKAERATKKVVRRARVKKIVPTRMVRKLKYKKKDTEYKIKSVPAEKVVTADVVWVFNTKTRKIAQYVAQDKVGILVKGTTLKNFDIDSSREKKLRKPEDFIKELASAGKVAQRSLLETVVAKETVPNGRINEHCVLLKVF